MKKIMIILLFLFGISQLQAISLSQVTGIAATFFKRSAQVSALPSATFVATAIISEFLEKNELKKKKDWSGPGWHHLFVWFVLPISLISSIVFNAPYSILNIAQNKSIFEVPVANLMPSTFLQGVAGGLTLLPVGFYVINKFFGEKINKNRKLDDVRSVLWHVSYYATIASMIFSSASVIAEIGEKVFAG